MPGLHVCEIVKFSEDKNRSTYNRGGVKNIMLRICRGSVGEGTLFQVPVSSKLDSQRVCTECLLM